MGELVNKRPYERPFKVSDLQRLNDINYDPSVELEEHTQQVHSIGRIYKYHR